MPELLFLAHRIPFPPDRGDKTRSFHILERIARLGTVHVACFADDAADAAHQEGLRQALGPALGRLHVETRRTHPVGAALDALRRSLPLSVALFASQTMRRFVDTILSERPIDAVYAFSGQMAQYVPDRGARFVMDFVDMDSAKFADYAGGGGAMGVVHRREAAKLADYERAAAARADVSLFVSEDEAALFRASGAAGDIRSLGNGVDLANFAPDAAFAPLPPKERGEGPIILFTGQMDYRPNIEAVSRFARRELPWIRAQRPDARFVIAGRNPARSVRDLAGPGVVVTGAVADMRSWLAAAQVVVAPLAIARGVQNKVLEAMAMGRAVVASPAAHRGIDAEPGRDLLVAEEPGDAVLSLIADPARAAAIGAAARRRMEAAYSWDARLAALPQLLGLADVRRAAA